MINVGRYAQLPQRTAGQPLPQQMPSATQPRTNAPNQPIYTTGSKPQMPKQAKKVEESSELPNAARIKAAAKLEPFQLYEWFAEWLEEESESDD